MVAGLNKWLLCLITPLLVLAKPVVYDGSRYYIPSPVSGQQAISDPQLHPLHVSVVELNHNAKDKTLEVSCKLFTDDFENILGKTYHVKVDLINPPDRVAVDKMINDYVQKHLSIKADGTTQSLSYIGFERESDATYCYFQADNVATVKKIDAKNTLMHDMFTDQVNLMHIIVGGNRKSTKLDYPAADASVSF